MSTPTGSDQFSIQLIFGTSNRRTLWFFASSSFVFCLSGILIYFLFLTINFHGKCFSLSLAFDFPISTTHNTSDETLEALSDAQIVAPAVLTADLHSADHRNSFLYVFDYQTKFGDYPQVSKQHSNFSHWISISAALALEHSYSKA